MGKATFTPSLRKFRFYQDGTESGSTALAAEDTNITLDADSSDVNFHLRLLIQETAGASGATTDDWRLQYSLNGGAYTNITTTSSVAKGFNSASLTDGNATTNRGTDGITDGTGSFVAGEICEDGLLDDMQLTASNFTEFLYSLTLVSADLAYGDSVNFRILLNGATFSALVVPNIIVASGTATYYFDGSDAAATDPNSTWTNETNTDDGNTATTASSGGTAGSESSNYIQIEGTNAPSSGDDIVLVTSRIHDGTSYSTAQTVTAPGGGWTWSILQGLEMRIWDGNPVVAMNVTYYEDGNAGGTELVALTHTNANNLVSIIELIVYLGGNDPPTVALNTADETEFTTATPTLEFTGTDSGNEDIRYNIQINPMSEYYFDGSGGITDSGTAWTDDSNAFDGNESTFAYTTTADADLVGDDTTAPTSGDTIVNVYARLRYSSDSQAISPKWTSLVLLTSPLGGWTWTKIQALQADCFINSLSDQGFVLINETTGVEQVGQLITSETITGGDDFRVHLVELYVATSPSTLDKVSGTDAGFANTVTGGDNDPFNSGEKADYDVQGGDALSNGKYAWRVRGIDPDGSNTYGAWSDWRTFTVNVAAGGTTHPNSGYTGPFGYF